MIFLTQLNDDSQRADAVRDTGIRFIHQADRLFSRGQAVDGTAAGGSRLRILDAWE